MSRVEPHPRSCVLPFLLVAFLVSGIAYAGNRASADRDDLKPLAKTYKIEIITTKPTFPVKTEHGTIAGKSADDKSLASYVPLFIEEFKLYPFSLVNRSALKRVVLCKNLSFAGQFRNAIPDYENDTLYLDVTRGTHDKAYLRKVIHHELFHLIDYQDDGNVYQDERWAALNPAKFAYGEGGRTAQDIKTTSVLTDKYPGFLNHYSTTGVEEDKAEVFANLMVDPSYVEKRIAKDLVLKAKVRRMKELLAGFCPAVKGEFWEKVKKVKRNDR